LASALAYVLLERPSPASTRRRTSSPATRPGASPPTLAKLPGLLRWDGTRNYQRPPLARRGAFGGERLSV